MSNKWLRLFLLLVALSCTAGLEATADGQTTDADAAQPPATPAETEAPAADDQPDAPAKDTPAKDTPAKTDAPKQDASEKSDAPKKDAPAKSEAPAATDAPDTPPEANKTEPAAPTAAPASSANADPAADQAVFAAKIDQWKTILKSLRELASRYTVATEDEADGIRKEWDDLIAQGERLIPELRAAGMAAYASGRGTDRTVERFLTKLLNDDITHDRYELAYDLGNSLIDNGCEVKEVFDATGVAAFSVNDYEAAERLLKRAQDAGSLSDVGQKNLAMIDEYKLYWEREKALREKEAAADDLPRVKITTNRGDIVVELLENEAPGTVGNFINLVEKKFYDGLTFHRVLPGFMAQGGCPRGDGKGGPGYMIKCETDADDYRMHFRGSLSMAHAGKDTGGSQFFLTFVPTANLNGKHTVFGRVIEGLDVLERLQRIDPEKPNPSIKPDTIVKMEVLRKRDHEYKPNKSQ